MLSSDPARARRVINFTDPESQKGFVYSPFLSPATRYPSPTLMGSRVSSSSWIYPLSFSLGIAFLRSSTCSLLLPLLISVHSPIFSPAVASAATAGNGVWIQHADTVVQLKSGSDRKLQYSGSRTEEKRPEEDERYRQLLRDRINRMKSEVAVCFS